MLEHPLSKDVGNDEALNLSATQHTIFTHQSRSAGWKIMVGGMSTQSGFSTSPVVAAAAD